MQERDKEPLQERFFRPHFLQAPGDMVAHEGCLCRLDCKVDSSIHPWFQICSYFAFVCLLSFLGFVFVLCVCSVFGFVFFQGKHDWGWERDHFFFQQGSFETFDTRLKYFMKFLSLYMRIKMTLVLYQVNPTFIKDNERDDIIQTLSIRCLESLYYYEVRVWFCIIGVNCCEVEPLKNLQA